MFTRDKASLPIALSCLAAALVALCLCVVSTEAATAGSRPVVPAGPPPSSGTAASKSKGKARAMHAAFEHAGEKKGLEIWRVENFEPVVYPKNDYGKFYTGDSYIVLNTKEVKGKLSWDVHFWLGSQTSQDEAGAAAIMAVELDDKLNGAPVQHREVQEHESQLFLSYFKSGVRYLPGGVSSGFTHVDINAHGAQRLFQVKGKKNIRVKEVQPSISSMNKGDCFILDSQGKIYVYVGRNSKRIEKIKAISAANQIRDQDHSGRARVNIIDEFSTESDYAEFFAALGSGSQDAVPEEGVGGDDAGFERSEEQTVTLYRVKDGSNTPEPVSQRPLTQQMLDTNDAFILDTGTSGIFVWVGKRSSAQEKSQAMTKAQAFLTSKKYPSWTQVRRIVEGAETTAFKQYFSTWRDHGMLHSRLIRSATDSDNEEEEFDPATLHALRKSGGRAMGFMPDNGAGDVEVFRVEDFELVAMEPETHGMFFGGDSYVIRYTYDGGMVIYFWQGKQSSLDEKAAAALHAARLDNEAGGRAVQVRVPQGHEPHHFLKIFKGKLIIFMGGRASGFRNLQDHDTYDVDGTRLFRIRATDGEDARAEQLPEVAASLSSDDVFVLQTPSDTYLWFGNGASDAEKEIAQTVASVVAHTESPIELEEGSEPDEFWDALGGKGEYSTELDAAKAPIMDPRLFHCKILANGRLRVEEINEFEQEDLDVDDINVLDGGDEVYVWVGNGSTEEEKEKSMKMAEHYLRTDPSERTAETTPIIVVHQGQEPRSFTRLFPAWDADLWESITSYEDMKNNVAAENELQD